MYSRTVDPDPHSFSLLDQDPGDEKQKKQKNRKNARQIHGNHYNFIKYDRESEIEDINKTLIIKPERHTFIFIKEIIF